MDNTVEDFNLKKITETLKPACVTVLSGASGSGKTTLALNILAQYSVCQLKSAAVFSMKMQSKNIIQRLLCLIAGVSIDSVSFGKLTAEEWQQICTATVALAHCNIFIDDTSCVTTKYIKEKIEELFAKKGNIHIIVIDYLQLVSCESLKGVLDELDCIAKTFKIPILILSQSTKASDITGNGTISKCNYFKGQWLIMRLNDNCERDIFFAQSENAGEVTPLIFTDK